MGHAAQHRAFQAGDAARAEIVQLERDLPVWIVRGPVEMAANDPLGFEGTGWRTVVGYQTARSSAVSI